MFSTMPHRKAWPVVKVALRTCSAEKGKAVALPKPRHCSRNHLRYVHSVAIGWWGWRLRIWRTGSGLRRPDYWTRRRWRERTMRPFWRRSRSFRVRSM
ncbi:hypothetical protein CJ030_MR3G005577 [Morella rubra]|uniref:Uncharacterized protein n=1 Tax=Morella rubra TaxID=262757 RepID=A0A6A1WBA0_9ROSI|nr:hypothetical protein CJ030_MR3G005577 [Morella rubra]